MAMPPISRSMAVRDSQRTLKRVARSRSTVNVQAHANVVDVVDSPAGAFEGDENLVAGRVTDDDARFERLGCVEHPHRRLACRFKNEAKRGAPSSIEEIRAQEELIFPGDARRRRQRNVAEGRRGDLNLAGRNAVAAEERGVDSATPLEESGG